MVSAAAARPRVLLFDWTEGGHHEEYLSYVARALRGDASVAIAAPESARGHLESEGDFVSLGPSRPVVAAEERGKLLAAERAALFGAIRRARATHGVHMFADELVPYLARGPRAPAQISSLIFRKASHYPLRFRSHLYLKELRREYAFDAWLWLWRQRPDAGAALLFDELAARLAARTPGAPVVWLPEAPVELPPSVSTTGERAGVAMTGALDWRKGIHHLADAVALRRTDMRVTLAGRPVAGYEDELQAHVEQMRGAGAEVDLRDRWIEPDEYLEVLSGARVIAAPYPRHRGMSRLIVEAAAAGTPVVADRYGLLGRLVREHRLGLVVNSARPAEFRGALDQFLWSDDVDREALRRFAGRYTQARFRSALLATIAKRS
jgi:glycosyltransferase involved in cell wall biosynthesis